MLDDPTSAGPVILGRPHPRVEGAAKVTGHAVYPGDVSPDGLAHAALVRSSIARGRIEAIETAEAMAVPGVLLVLTHETLGTEIRPVKHALGGGWANSTWRPLASADIAYGGQIVALVVADTPEHAEEAANLVAVSYEAAPHATHLGLPDVVPVPVSALRQDHEDRTIGDARAAFEAAPVRIDAEYTTPIQHHNPIELPTTTCVWSGDRLTVYEPTRYVYAAQHGLAAQLGMDPADVRVVATLVGGHFGGKLSLSQQTALVAIASRRVGRPIRLAVSRRDQFTTANHRTETWHRVRLGASPDGRLVSLSHEACAATSRFDDFFMEGTDVTTALYACPAIMARESVARVDRNTPGPMRAPPEVPYLFALESAMDELARALAIDPIELRRRNETATDPVTGHPFTTRPLLRCFEAGAAAFGWPPQPAAPGSRLRDGWRIGYGCAAAARPVKAGSAIVRLTLDGPDRVAVETAHHEIGNGLATLLALVTAERLNIPIANVTVRLGDTHLPPAGISGGSSSTTTLVNALAEACRALRERSPGETGPLDYTYGATGDALAALRTGRMKLATPPPGRLSWTFGAQFVEVRVHAATGEIRVPRHVGAFAAGRILNPLAADSQLRGGMIWGQSAALLEETVIDRASGTYLNTDLAEYLVPTSADVGDVRAIMVDDDDPAVNPEGVKGLGEIGIIGVSAAIANAIFDATGQRFRSLPIRLDHLVA